MKKLTRKAVRFKGLTLGLDLHKKFIEWCVLDRAGEEIGAGRIRSTREELEKLHEKWSGQAVQVCMEACGCFVWVFDFFKEKVGGGAVHVAQPSRVHVIANSMEKNDANDAWWLAYLLYEGRLPEAYVAEGALRDLRIATRELRACTEERSDLLRRFKSHLAQAGIPIAKNWHASGKGRVEARRKIAAISGERRNALERLLKRTKQLGGVVAYWRERMVALSAGLPLVKTLSEELPGFGPQTAAIVLAEMNEPPKYSSAKAYAKATGLTPGSRESGGKSQPVGITRAGSRHARWAFTRAVIACLRCKGGVGAQIRQWIAERIRYKPKRKVIVAAARKLAEGVWRLLAMGEVFDLKRAFPVKATPAK
jgi:transposase